MSDGPYRSLPLRPAWKMLAKRAEQSTYDPQDIADWVCPALEGDWRAEISSNLLNAVRDFCEKRQRSLFGDEAANALAALHRVAFAQGTLGATVADYALQAVQAGKYGVEALRDAVTNALFDRFVCSMRGTEEHYLRESTKHRASHVRQRLEAAIMNSQGQIAATVDRIICGEPIGRSSPPNHSGLDDGVGLP